jgi:hypothetical protein
MFFQRPGGQAFVPGVEVKVTLRTAQKVYVYSEKALGYAIFFQRGQPGMDESSSSVG